MCKLYQQLSIERFAKPFSIKGTPLIHSTSLLHLTYIETHIVYKYVDIFDNIQYETKPSAHPPTETN